MVQIIGMDVENDIKEAGVSPNADAVDTSPSLHVKKAAHLEGTNSVPQSEDNFVDPLHNSSADSSTIVAIDDDKNELLTALTGKAVTKDEGGGDEEDVGTGSFENLSPLSDDVEPFTKGFRKVLRMS